VIIKSFRTPTAYGHNRFRNHIFRGDENERIALVQGVERDVEDFFEDARRDGRKNAVRHFIISPESQTTPVEMMQVVCELGKELGFDPAAAVIIEHQKPRATEGVFDRHWHVICADWDPETGTIETSHNFARQEKIARLAEWRLGHPFVLGAHHSAVLAALEREGWGEAAAALRSTFPEAVLPVRSAYTHDEAQKAKRAGKDLAPVRELVRMIWASTTTADELRNRLAGHGLTVAVGARRNAAWFVADKKGAPLLRLAGAAHVTRAEIIARMGDPNDARAGRPREAADSSTGSPYDQHAANEKSARRDGGALDRAVASDSSAVAGFVENLKDYATNIESLLKVAIVLATPPAIEFEQATSAAEARARELIDSAEQFSLQESKDLKSARKSLTEAESLVQKRSVALEKAEAKLAEALAMPRPFFGRSRHDRYVAEVRAWHGRTADRLKLAKDAKASAAKEVAVLADFHRSDEKHGRAEVARGVPKAQEELKVLTITRSIVAKNPLMLRWGAWALYNMGWAEHRRQTTLRVEQENRPWNGEVDIWGIPIEPPRPFQP
jgi:hypothetical protein